jgi:hypothetical protein
METIEVDGLRVAYESAGSGPPLVLLHGSVGGRPDDLAAAARRAPAWRSPPATAGRRSRTPPGRRSPPAPATARCSRAVIAVGWGVFTWVVPPYARGELGVGSRLIGLLLFANALTVVLAQLPVARLAEGRRRALAMAVASLTFTAACLLVVGVDLAGWRWRSAYAALLVAAVAVGVGECFHTTVLMPLTPTSRRRRYAAATWRRSGCRGGSGWRWRRRWGCSC